MLITLTSYESLKVPSPLHEEASLIKAAAALTHIHTHPYFEGNLAGTSYPFKQNSSNSLLIMIYYLSSPWFFDQVYGTRYGFPAVEWTLSPVRMWLPDY